MSHDQISNGVFLQTAVTGLYVLVMKSELQNFLQETILLNIVFYSEGQKQHFKRLSNGFHTIKDMINKAKHC